MPIISPITTNSFTVRDSFSFAKEISCLTFNSNFHMASFDVTSLFTNIPLQETIDIILFEIFENEDNNFNLSVSMKNEKILACSLFGNENEKVYFTKSQFKELLELATLDNHFYFNGEIYKQIDGVAMGSPLGPTLANVFMSHMEKRWLKDCPLEFKPILYRRYVDDSFLLFNSDQHIQQFLEYLNNKHESIKFTVELSKNNILPFLDIKIKKESNGFSTSIYRKPTFTGLMSKYNDFAPITYKENLIYTLVCRAFHISSDYLSFHLEIETLKNFLRKNSYPLDFIEKHIGIMIRKLYKPPNSKTELNFDVPKPIVYFTTYYLGNVSKVMTHELKLLVRQFYPQLHLRILFKSSNTIGNRFSHKDKVPELTASNVIYKYTCKSCQAFYIGKTKQQLITRITQHQGVSARTGREVMCKAQSDIREHCLKCKVPVETENFSILDRLHSENGLVTLETLYQKISRPSIGIQQQSTPVLCFD